MSGWTVARSRYSVSNIMLKWYILKRLFFVRCPATLWSFRPSVSLSLHFSSLQHHKQGALCPSHTCNPNPLAWVPEIGTGPISCRWH